MSKLISFLKNLFTEHKQVESELSIKILPERRFVTLSCKLGDNKLRVIYGRRTTDERILCLHCSLDDWRYISIHSITDVNLRCSYNHSQNKTSVYGIDNPEKFFVDFLVKDYEKSRLILNVINEMRNIAHLYINGKQNENTDAFLTAVSDYMKASKKK